MATRQLGAKKFRVLPGFRLTLGFTLFYLGLIVLIPLAATFAKTATLTWAQFSHTVFSPVALASYRLTFGASFVAALVNAFFGLIVAWVLVRYNFLGKRIVDALVDLPFALPTAVAGITLATLYAQNDGQKKGCISPIPPSTIEANPTLLNHNNDPCDF